MALVGSIIRRSLALATATSGEPMINVAQARAALLAAPGDTVAFSKEQAAQLLAELEVGQKARRALSNLRTMTAVAASAAGAPA